MASFNKVMLMGNITRDPDLRYTPSGQAVCDLSLAINNKYSSNGQEREDVCFVDIVVWAKQAESCSKYLKKGSPIFVEGRLKSDSWEDKEGNKRSKMRVTAERVQFLSSRSDGQSYQKREDNNSYQKSYDKPSSPQNNFARENNNQQPASSPSQNFQGNQQSAQSAPMPPPPEVFDNNEPEDDIPF